MHALDGPATRLGQARLVFVVGASGGSGASTLTAAIALHAARQWGSVTAVDGQPGGSGLDVIFGVDHVGGLRWPDLAGVDGAVDAPALAVRLPLCDGVRVLSHARPSPAPPAAAIAGVMAGLCGSAGPDVVVVDLPRYAVSLPDWGGWLADPFDGRLVVVVVADAGVVGLASLASTAPWVHEAVRRAGVVATVVLRGDAMTTGLIHDVEDAVELPIGAVVGHDREVTRDLARGRPPTVRVDADLEVGRQTRGRRVTVGRAARHPGRAAPGDPAGRHTVAAAAAGVCRLLLDAQEVAS